MKPACNACKFYSADDGTCRRHPPVITERITMPTTGITESVPRAQLAGVPRVSPDFWCGEFVARRDSEETKKRGRKH